MCCPNPIQYIHLGRTTSRGPPTFSSGETYRGVSRTAERLRAMRLEPLLGQGAGHIKLSFKTYSLRGWGLIDLPLRASNEGLLRPRVARAQKIISLHPLFCSASKKGTWPLPSSRSRRGHAGVQVGVVGQDNPTAGRSG
jgi:hypothetical protein